MVTRSVTNVHVRDPRDEGKCTEQQGSSLCVRRQGKHNQSNINIIKV